MKEPQTNESTHPPRRDFRQEVTKQIIAMLEKGAAPWQKSWEPSGAGVGMPGNPTIGKLYGGANAILLATGLQRGYDDPRRMTYSQAKQEGWQARKEKGTQIEFWDVKPRSARKEREDDGTEQPARDRLIHRVYSDFNAKQIAGIPACKTKRPRQFELIQTGEAILEGSGAAHRPAGREVAAARVSVFGFARARTFDCRGQVFICSGRGEWIALAPMLEAWLLVRCACHPIAEKPLKS